MMPITSRPTRLLARILAGVLLFVLATPATAWAQAPIEVVGTADFRDPPTLVPGQYVDTIVTGDTVWYAVVYANDTPYRFEASLPDGQGGSGDELTLLVSFVAPTLGPIGESSAVVQGSGARYNNGHTNVWYLKVSLETTGRLGIEHRILVDIEGVEATGFGDCTQMPTCTLDDELASIDNQIADVEAAIADIPPDDDVVSVGYRLDDLRFQVSEGEERLAQADADLADAAVRMAELCAPETTCTTFPDPGSGTPVPAWVFGGLVFVTGVGFAVSKRLGIL